MCGMEVMNNKTASQIMIEERNAQLAANYIIKGKSEDEIIENVTKLALTLNTLINSLDETNGELLSAINEINRLKAREIHCQSETPPDYWDAETCYLNDKLLYEIRNQTLK